MSEATHRKRLKAFVLQLKVAAYEYGGRGIPWARFVPRSAVELALAEEGLQLFTDAPKRWFAAPKIENDTRGAPGATTSQPIK